MNLPELLGESRKTKLVPIVSSAKAFRIICRRWLEKIVPEVIEEVQSFEKMQGKEIPVVPAGGIYTGSDIVKLLELGAAGSSWRPVSSPRTSARRRSSSRARISRRKKKTS